MYDRSIPRVGLLILLTLGVAFGSFPTPGGPRLPGISVAQAAGYPIRLTPDQLALTGDVATKANSAGRCPERYFDGTPPGTIVLGVDPASCSPDTWGGGSATARLALPNVYAPTVLVLKIAWTQLAGKGIHSPDRGRIASIRLDGRPLWDKRTEQLGTYGDYFAAEQYPILTTIVLTQTAEHTLEFSVPARTAWDISQIELSARPFPARMQGVGYSPYRDCEAPGGRAQPTVQDIREDLFRLKHTSSAIRTYAATDATQLVPALANAIGLPVYAGAWIDHKPASDAVEVANLIELAHTTKLAGMIVGNEYYLRNSALLHKPPDPDADVQVRQYLIDRIAAVRQATAGTGVPIGTAEIDGLAFNWTSDATAQVKPEYAEILKQVDFMMVHIYPFWMGRSIDGAAALVVNRFKAMQKALAEAGLSKRLIIGETGWPSRGQTYGAAVPTLENQRRYLIEFMALAEQARIDYMYFDPFDELWKIEEGQAGQNWGYGHTDRTAKHDFFGVLTPAALLPALGMAPPMHLSAAAGAAKILYFPLIATSPHDPFPVYAEWPGGPNHYVPSGFMGDPHSVDVYECDRGDPHGGELAVRATYTPAGPAGWGGVYWQFPENNWAVDPGGFNMGWANKLTFWAKGAKGGEKVQFVVGGIGKKGDPYPDSLRPAASTGFIALDRTWRQYTINLVGLDLKRLSGGFGWVTNQCTNPGGATFYLDDVQFEADPRLQAPPPHGATLAVYTDAAAPGSHYVPSLWTGDGSVKGRVTFTECWQDNPHGGRTSIKIDYQQQVLGWTGMYWVDPAENKGDLPGGLDLSGATSLTFWARSDTPNAAIKVLIGGVGYQANYLGETTCEQQLEDYADSLCPPVSKEFSISEGWQPYTIDLRPYQHQDWSRVVGGFGWVSTKPITLYLDDIVYAFD